MYSDQVAITNNRYNRQETTLMMLTTDAIYHLPADNTNDFKKCDRRKPWSTVSWCILLNPEELCIDDVVYGTDSENMTSILVALHEADVEVLFQREEDGIKFREDECKELPTLPPAVSNSNYSRSAYSEIHGTDHYHDELNMHNVPNYDVPGLVEAPSFDEQELEDNCRESSVSTAISTDSTSTPAMRDIISENAVRMHVNRSGRSGSRKSLKAKDFTLLSVIGRGRFGKICTVKKKGEATVYAMKILKKAEIIELGQEKNIQSERKVLMRYDV